LRAAQQKVEVLLSRNGEETIAPFSDTASSNDEKNVDDPDER
jgi:hypothetical protein